MASEEPSGALSYKVCVLKVSIHCQGCKKKIHRILKKIDEVYKVDIDAPQNKVTVIGNVDGETLVKKLAKSRKYAELLPPEEKEVVDGDGPGSKDETKEPSETEEQEKNTAEDTAATAASPEQKTADNAEAPTPPSDAAADSAKSTDEIEEKGKEQAESDDEIVEVSNTPPVKAAETEENAPDTSEKAGAGANDTAGGGCKKKGKKAQKGGKGEVAENSRPVEDATDGPMRTLASYIYPPLQQHPYYAMNYDVAEPRVRSTHYVPSVPPASAFVYEPYPPPTEFYYGGALLPHPQSYSMFSDEDPNSCHIL